MAFDGDQVVWKAGNLTKPPIFRTYDDGNEVVYLSLAIDHQGKPTEFWTSRHVGSTRSTSRFRALTPAIS